MNDAWLAALGFDRADVAGRFVRDLHETHSRERLWDDVIPLFRLSGAARSIACTFTHRSGAPVDLIVDAEMLDALGPDNRSRSLIVAVQEAARWRGARTVLRALVDFHQIAVVLDQPQAAASPSAGPSAARQAISGAVSPPRAQAWATEREIALETMQSLHEAELACGVDDTECLAITARVNSLMQEVLSAVEAEGAAAQS